MRYKSTRNNLLRNTLHKYCSGRKSCALAAYFYSASAAAGVRWQHKTQIHQPHVGNICIRAIMSVVWRQIAAPKERQRVYFYRTHSYHGALATNLLGTSKLGAVRWGLSVKTPAAT